MADTFMANDDGNCLPSHHEGSRNGGFQRVEQNSYEENDDSDDDVILAGDALAANVVTLVGVDVTDIVANNFVF